MYQNMKSKSSQLVVWIASIILGVAGLLWTGDVSVYAQNGTNLALLRVTTQGIGNALPSHNAVDGNTSGNYLDGIHTGRSSTDEIPAYWQVNLEAPANLNAANLRPSVHIYDRMNEYKSSIPLTQTEFDELYAEMRPVLYNGAFWDELANNYPRARGEAAIARLDELINYYFPDGRPAEDSCTASNNVALQKRIVDFSSQEGNSAWAASNINDGVVNATDRAWASKGISGDVERDEWVIIDLGRSITIDSITIQNEDRWSNRNVKNYVLYGSHTGEFTGEEFVIDRGTAPPLSNQAKHGSRFTPTTTRYIKFQGTSSYSSYVIVGELCVTAAPTQENIALNKTVTGYSSQVNNTKWSAENINDGRTDAEKRGWASAAGEGTRDEWVIIDLGAPYTLGSFVLQNEHGASNRNVKDYVLYGSDTGEFMGEEFILDIGTIPPLSAKAEHAVTFDPASARYVKFQGTSSHSTYVIVGELSLFLADPAEIIFDQFPSDRQLYPRNTTSNTAIVEISGRFSNVHRNLVLKAYRNGELWKTWSRSAEQAPDFLFRVAIPAELANYDFELHSGGTVLRTAQDVVAGDVFVINGQSNAVAGLYSAAGEGSGDSSEFIRTYGAWKQANEWVVNDGWYVTQPDCRPFSNLTGCIGRLGQRLAKNIVSTEKIPVAVINGAHGGQKIEYFARNDANPTDTSNNYGRMLTKLRMAGLEDNVRAWLWYQGESDRLNVQGHIDGFTALFTDWETDYPSVEQYYIFQIRHTCVVNDLVTGQGAEISNFQREFANSKSNASPISTTGIDEHDGCHYPYEGYKKLADNASRIMRHDLYGANYSNADASDIVTAGLIDATTLELTFTPNNTLIADDGFEALFELRDRDSDVVYDIVDGMVINGENVQLTLAQPLSVDINLDLHYYSLPGDQNWLTNQEGIGILSFVDFPVANPPIINLAYEQSATQSTTGYGGVPGRAVDGDTNGDFFDNSVTHTNSGSVSEPSWWEVDLGEVSDLTDIVLWNRTDCCSSRLVDVHIFVSDVPFEGTTLESSQNQAGVSDYYVNGVVGENVTVDVGRTGRYVRVQLSNVGVLSLAEVEIFGVPLVNLARQKSTAQSTTGYGGLPERAVDGNTSGNWGDRSVTHTNSGSATTPSWWEVDLGEVSDITAITLWNRTDCCSGRLNNVHVFVSDVPFAGTTLASSLNQAGVSDYYVNGVVGETVTVDVGRTGRYVRVQLSNVGVLSLAEAQVFGKQLTGMGQATTSDSSSSTVVSTSGIPMDSHPAEVVPTAVNVANIVADTSQLIVVFMVMLAFVSSGTLCIANQNISRSRHRI